jgi:hypothetical protein
MDKMSQIKTEDIEKSGFIITIEEVWTKDHKTGFWIAKDTGGRVCHASTPENALKGLREMFWKEVEERAKRFDEYGSTHM